MASYTDKDFLFGRNGFCRNNGGNKFLAQLAQNWYKRYRQADARTDYQDTGKLSKDKINKKLVKMLEDTGGRFLAQNKWGVWVEVPQWKAVARVVQEFNTITKNKCGTEPRVAPSTRPCDVLLGGQHHLHARPGNVLLRSVVRGKLEDFKRASNNPHAECREDVQARVIDNVINQIESIGGRFLTMNALSEEWEEVSHEVAVDKVRGEFLSCDRLQSPSLPGDRSKRLVAPKQETGMDVAHTPKDRQLVEAIPPTSGTDITGEEIESLLDDRKQSNGKHDWLESVSFVGEGLPPQLLPFKKRRRRNAPHLLDPAGSRMDGKQACFHSMKEVDLRMSMATVSGCEEVGLRRRASTSAVQTVEAYEMESKSLHEEAFPSGDELSKNSENRLFQQRQGHHRDNRMEKGCLIEGNLASPLLPGKTRSGKQQRRLNAPQPNLSAVDAKETCRPSLSDEEADPRALTTHTASSSHRTEECMAELGHPSLSDQEANRGINLLEQDQPPLPRERNGRRLGTQQLPRERDAVSVSSLSTLPVAEYQSLSDQEANCEIGYLQQDLSPLPLVWMEPRLVAEQMAREGDANSVSSNTALSCAGSYQNLFDQEASCGVGCLEQDLSPLPLVWMERRLVAEQLAREMDAVSVSSNTALSCAGSYQSLSDQEADCRTDGLENHQPLVPRERREGNGRRLAAKQVKGGDAKSVFSLSRLCCTDFPNLSGQEANCSIDGLEEDEPIVPRERREGCERRLGAEQVAGEANAIGVCYSVSCADHQGLSVQAASDGTDPMEQHQPPLPRPQRNVRRVGAQQMPGGSLSDLSHHVGALWIEELNEEPATSTEKVIYKDEYNASMANLSFEIGSMRSSDGSL